MSSATAVKITTDQQESLSDGELRAWRGLLRAHACLAKRLDAALEREHGLPMSSYEVLHRLDEAGAGRMRMCDLADQAQLSRSGLTRLVDRLERDRLLERCSCEHDARGSYACLTELGRERLAQARTTHLAVIREHFFSRFSEPELAALADMWDRVAPCANGNGDVSDVGHASGVGHANGDGHANANGNGHANGDGHANGNGNGHVTGVGHANVRAGGVAHANGNGHS
ncbi:MAG TPA: MarR family transcriptional regulator [Solirubrobacteraceae bacterium]|nr:MarR family transcriptional regulator [Solirubrobacteraceae bacterium]